MNRSNSRLLGLALALASIVAVPAHAEKKNVYQFSVFYDQVGATKLLAGNYSKAEEYARKKIDSPVTSRRYDAANTLCISLHLQDKPTEAFTFCQQAVEMAGKRFERASRNRADRWQRGDQDSSERQRYSQALNNLGVHWALQGNIAQAQDKFAEAQAQYPGLKQAKRNQNRAAEQIQLAQR